MVIVLDDCDRVILLPPAKTIVPDENVVSVPVVLPLALRIFAKASMVALDPALEMVTILPCVMVVKFGPEIVIVLDDCERVMLLPPARTIVPVENVVSVPVVLPLALTTFPPSAAAAGADMTTEPLETPTLTTPAPSNESADSARFPDVACVVLLTA